jgi:Flp pilus assembly protein TadG
MLWMAWIFPFAKAPRGLGRRKPGSEPAAPPAWPRAAFRLFADWIADDRGVAAVLTALMLPILCGMIGLGLDTANWYINQRQVQRIAEASALAAAPLLSNSANTHAMVTAVASNTALLNGFSTAANDSIAVSFGTSPSSVTVSVTRTLQNSFSALLFKSTPQTTGTATAGVGGNSVCILVVDPSSSQTFLVNSGVTFNAPNCEIDVASTSSSAAMFNSSLSDVLKVCVAGSSTVNGGSTINNLTNGCSVASDPYASSIPTPTVGSCTVSNQNYSGTVNLSPGTYCGSFNFNGSGTANLSAGTYIFNGTVWNLNSGWTINGTGVTFYFATSSSYIQINSNVTTNLSAPTTGTYANVLMFEPSGLSTSNIAIDGSSTGHLLQGLIHLPSRNITFNSTSNVLTDGLTLVVHQLIFDTMTWSIQPGTDTITSSGGSSSSATGAVLLN